MDLEFARDVLIFLSLAIGGLLSRGVAGGYRREMDNLARIEKEVAARQAAEEQLEFLIESSPAAILTMAPGGEILLANPAAHRLLGVPRGLLPGQKIARYVPALGSIPPIDESARIFRTEMQTRGQRENGEAFLADVFFSTYSTPAGSRLAALVVDASEQMREREETSLQQLMAGSRILVAAVSHEVRNVCGAIGMMHENLARSGFLSGNQDFEALGSLVETLSRIASLELKQSVGRTEPETADLNEVLADLQIVLEPSCAELDIELHCDFPAQLPLVEADRHSLMQVLLNLSKNSQRALETSARKAIYISASGQPSGAVAIRFTDTGPGIRPGQKLFQPLQKGADATGLGLYLSRAFMRSFHGDLRHDPPHPGCSFVLDLAPAADNSADGPAASGDPVLSVPDDATHTTFTA